MKLSIIVPIYNERRWLDAVWLNLRRAPIDQCQGIDSVEIIVVDDGSTDGTAELLKAIDGRPFHFECGMDATVRVRLEPENHGKGYVVRQGIRMSTGDIVLIQDADLEYSPQDYPVLLRPFFEQGADAVFGSRFVGHPRRVLFFWHSVLNHFLTLLSNMLCDVNLTDMETGYKVMRGAVARELRLTSNRFGLEPELVSRLAKGRFQIYEVPIRYRGRTYREGKKIRAKDGIAALFHILRFGLFDTQPFEPGLQLTLNSLESANEQIYLPLLRRALGIALRGNPEPTILEIGAGTGAMTGELLDRGKVTATDLSPEFVLNLKRRYQHFSSFEGRVWDATTPWPDGRKFDLIVACNVLEHLQDDHGALSRWRELLNEGGTLVLIVPQFQSLYSNLDRELGHFRRYRPEGLKTLVEGAGLAEKSYFFGNPIALMGWLVTGKWLGTRHLPESQLRIYRWLKVILGPVDKLFSRFTGINIVYLASRPRAASDSMRRERKTA